MPCLRQRVALKLPTSTTSAWDALRGPQFVNADFIRDASVLVPVRRTSTARAHSQRCPVRGPRPIAQRCPQSRRGALLQDLAACAVRPWTMYFCRGPQQQVNEPTSILEARCAALMRDNEELRRRLVHRAGKPALDGKTIHSDASADVLCL